MGFNATLCVCICFFCSSAAQVEWKVSDKVSVLGEDLKIFCTTNNYKMSSNKAKRWYGGPSRKMLSLNGKPSDLNKYNATVEMHGFGLIIKNVTENDFNVFYKCTYGFDDKSDKLLLKSDSFKVISSDIPKMDVRVTDKDSTIIGMAVGIPLTIMLIVLVIGFCVWYKRRPTTPITNSGDNSEANLENGTVHLLNNNVHFSNQEANLENGTVHLLNNNVHFSNQVTNIIENGTARPDSNGVLFSNQANSSSYLTEEETIPHKAAGFTTTSEPQTTQTISSPASFTVPSTRSRLQEVGDNNTEQTDGCPQANIGFENEIQTHGEEDHRCKHSEYKQLKLRKKSFTGTMRFEPNAEQMANAGFFFLVTAKSDYAECFCCGSKRHWKAGDDPFDMAFHSNCHYIRTMGENKNCTERKDTDETDLKSI